MSRTLHTVLSRRERQIMDILFRRGRATAADVMDELPTEAGYSTVRTQLRVLEQKGHVRHQQEGPRFVYTPVVRTPRGATSRRCVISSTRSSTVHRRRPWPRCSAVKRRSCRTSRSIGLPT